MIELTQMTPAEFDDYLDHAVRSYGESRIRSGQWQPGEAPELAEKTLRDLLPDGLQTPGHQLLAIRDLDLGRAIGYLWLGLSSHGAEVRAYIYDFVVLEEYRRRGYGKAALQALEDKARGMGVHIIAAHVYSEDYVARALYDQIGYTVDEATLTKLVQ